MTQQIYIKFTNIIFHGSSPSGFKLHIGRKNGVTEANIPICVHFLHIMQGTRNTPKI